MVGSGLQIFIAHPMLYWGDDADNFIIRGTKQNQGTMLRELIGK